MRIREAKNLGFSRCLASTSSANVLKRKGDIRVETVANLRQAIQKALPSRRGDGP